ncbi:hypothetical protein AVEN_149918-1 [Araneus ventricosus]|uniref:Uncharacterized protein n=1 Tax=Araneus ventricosus TaxID=182803 RepID=A0A4Y2DZ57_ARAVE|nr:hypothetical protein AVEN_149918-1 [Araneus ventricosus]
MLRWETEDGKRKHVRRSVERRKKLKHVAGVIELPLSTVEKKMSQMILDKKLNEVLGFFESFKKSLSDKPLKDIQCKTVDVRWQYKNDKELEELVFKIAEEEL